MDVDAERLGIRLEHEISARVLNRGAMSTAADLFGRVHLTVGGTGVVPIVIDQLQP